MPAGASRNEASRNGQELVPGWPELQANWWQPLPPHPNFAKSHPNKPEDRQVSRARRLLMDAVIAGNDAKLDQLLQLPTCPDINVRARLAVGYDLSGGERIARWLTASIGGYSTVSLLEQALLRGHLGCVQLLVDAGAEFPRSYDADFMRACAGYVSILLNNPRLRYRALQIVALDDPAALTHMLLSHFREPTPITESEQESLLRTALYGPGKSHSVEQCRQLFELAVALGPGVKSINRRPYAARGVWEGDLMREPFSSPWIWGDLFLAVGLVEPKQYDLDHCNRSKMLDTETEKRVHRAEKFQIVSIARATASALLNYPSVIDCLPRQLPHRGFVLPPTRFASTEDDYNREMDLWKEETAAELERRFGCIYGNKIFPLRVDKVAAEYCERILHRIAAVKGRDELEDVTHTLIWSDPLVASPAAMNGIATIRRIRIQDRKAQLEGTPMSIFSSLPPPIMMHIQSYVRWLSVASQAQSCFEMIACIQDRLSGLRRKKRRSNEHNG